MKLMTLLTDAFGCQGGIAKFNRDFLTVLAAHPQVSSIIVIPRHVKQPLESLPIKLTYLSSAARNKISYIWCLLATLVKSRGVGGVICGHINLLPLSALASFWYRKPLVLIIHGIDAWDKPKSVMARLTVSLIDSFISVSNFTKSRFLAWSGLSEEIGTIIPNSIDTGRFSPGPRRKDLNESLGLDGKTVLFTLGRMSAHECYKGFDEVIEALPRLAQEIPNIIYMVGGDGDDRARLEQKASDLGVADRVVFTGFIPESDKTDYYRLADVFVMPGRGEGFGIVYLEAMACGIPVIASTADASREAVRDGMLGEVVDPDNQDELISAILSSIHRKERTVPEGIEYFSFERFEERWFELLENCFTIKKAVK